MIALTNAHAGSCRTPFFVDKGHQDCDHGVTFDPVAATKLSVQQIRNLFPRLYGLCPKGCGFHGIAYASTEHYIYGDW